MPCLLAVDASAPMSCTLEANMALEVVLVVLLKVVKVVLLPLLLGAVLLLPDLPSRVHRRFALLLG